MKNFNIPIKRAAYMSFDVEAENKDKAKDIALERAYNTDWASCGSVEYYNVGEDVPNFMLGMDWQLLRQQKETLVDLANNVNLNIFGVDYRDAVDGIINLLDSIQDYAVDVMEVPEDKVFDLKK